MNMSTLTTSPVIYFPSLPSVGYNPNFLAAYFMARGAREMKTTTKKKGDHPSA